MAASNEWTEYHLTEDGWVEGDQKRDFGKPLSRPTPPGRVLSFVYKETGNGYGPLQGSNNEIWRGSDEALIAVLLEKFGPAPQEI